MAAIKPLASIVEKWQRVTPGRSADYEAGVKNPRVPWDQATLAAESSWAQGVQAAISAKRFGAGVKKAGAEKWQRKAVEVGVGRWGPGVSAAVSDYEKGMAPVVDAISKIDLGPKYAVGDPRNIERVAKIAAALHKLKG